MIRAYCYASGRIGFGQKIPVGALIVARGPAESLHKFIEPLARRVHRTRRIRGRWRQVPGSECFLVPGVPEAPNHLIASERLDRWRKWLATKAPAEVRVLPL